MNLESLRIQLRKQLGFLERSCANFDVGYEDEAIRIAVVIRVLLHDTKHSKSLLSLLGAKAISLLSTCSLLDNKAIFFSGGLSSLEVKVLDGRLVGTMYKPNLDSSEPKSQYIDVESWWTQVIYRINEGEISRKRIVLGAANRDGGAHVDADLTADYEALCRGILTISHYSVQKASEYQVPNSHLSDLRQMGHELLNSPNLIALT